MKRIITKCISILLAAIMFFSVFPMEAYAWGKMTHVYTANVIDGCYIDTEGDNVPLNYPYDAEDEDAFHFAIPPVFQGNCILC